jgi:hypothetical protein
MGGKMMRTIAGFLMAGVLCGCAADVDDHIATLAGGGEGREDAKTALSLARQDAIDPLLEAVADESYGLEARGHMADALFRLYLREKEPRIFSTFVDLLGHREARVRQPIARILGDIGGREAVAALISWLPSETDDGVRQEILVGLGLMSLREQTTQAFPKWSLDVIDLELRTPFLEALKAMRGEALSDSLRGNLLEWLEVIAEGAVEEARQRELSADLAGAEQLLSEALELVPDSRNVNQRFGKFLYESGQPERGLQLLTSMGAAIRVPNLSRPPQFDGVIEDHEWRGAARIERLYQNVARMRAFEVEGLTDVYVAHGRGRIYIAVKAYEPQTDSLTATATERDQNTWLDDCVELFFDPDRDQRTYYQVVVNHAGTIFDQHNDGTSRGGDRSWNAELEHGTQVGADHWSLEVAIPLAQFGEGETGSGAVWGANLARIRIANASEYGQWAPTYGSALEPGRFGYLVFE